MANYVFAYSGGKGVSADETERNEQYAQWGRWFEELGSAIVDGGAAMGTAKTVGPSGSVSDGGSRALTGYSIGSVREPGRRSSYDGKRQRPGRETSCLSMCSRIAPPVITQAHPRRLPSGGRGSRQWAPPSTLAVRLFSIVSKSASAGPRPTSAATP
jgi:hypothetical protein